MNANIAAFPDIARRYGMPEVQFLLRWGVQNGYAVEGARFAKATALDDNTGETP